MIHRNICDEAYNALPGVRASMLKSYARSGLAGAADESRRCSTPSGSMRLGTALHAAVLEPEKYAARWVEVKGLKPGSDLVATEKTRKSTMTWDRADKALEVDDQYPLAEGWADQIAAMRQAIMDHRDARRLIENRADTELGVTWTDGALLVEGKAKIDLTVPTSRGLFLADIKTTRAETLDEFEKDCARYGYHVQAAWYMRAAMMGGLCDHEPGFAFLAVTNYEPIDVVLCYPCEDMIRQGRVDCERAVSRLKRWRAEGIAEGMSPGWVPLDLPRWTKDETTPTHDWSTHDD